MNNIKTISTSSDQRYMLIFRSTDWYKGLSPQETQQIIDQWMVWFKNLTDQGIAIGGNPLEHEGKIVSGKNGQVIADGPFAEAKETIGGYFMLRLDTLDEAVAIAKQCPGLPYGIKVEVRPVGEECSSSKEDRKASLAEMFQGKV
jgi:hypothetical protein